MKFHFHSGKKLDRFSLKFRDLSGAKVCKSCRSRQELSNEYLLAKIGVDTAENEPLEVCRENSIQYSLHSLVLICGAICAAASAWKSSSYLGRLSPAKRQVAVDGSPHSFQGWNGSPIQNPMFESSRSTQSFKGETPHHAIRAFFKVPLCVSTGVHDFSEEGNYEIYQNATVQYTRLLISFDRKDE